jgi:hypothetical protein
LGKKIHCWFPTSESILNGSAGNGHQFENILVKRQKIRLHQVLLGGEIIAICNTLIEIAKNAPTKAVTRDTVISSRKISDCFEHHEKVF